MGFKSFPKKTVFKLKGGITTFVGPNGCGKTNIIDAVKWGLGEMSTKALRAERLEDLIFNGTENKSAVGMAEVKLLFQNNGGIPLEYEEVEIKRRYFRSGEGNFFINNTPCRLRDIQTLFANTGLRGAILDHQMIEDFLLSDSNLRRELLESIAGIKKYRENRLEALNKLNSVERSLEKIEIILREKKKVKRSLKREANRAKKFRELQVELKRKVILISKSKLFFFYSEMKEKEKAIEELEAHLEKMLGRIAKESREIEWGEEELNAERKKFDGLVEQIEEIQDTLLNLRERKAGIEGELKHLVNFLNNLPADLETTLKEEEKKLLNLKGQEEKISSLLPEYETGRERISGELEKILLNIRSLEGKELSLEVKIREQKTYVDSIETHLKELNQSLRAKEEQLKEFNIRLTDSDKELKKNAEAINKLQEMVVEKESKKTSLLRQLQHRRTELSRIEKEIEFYQSRDSELSEGMRILKEEMKLPILSDNIEVEKGFEAVIEAVMEDSLNGAVGTIDEIEKAIDFLVELSVDGGILIVDDGKENKKNSKLSEKVTGKFSYIIREKLSRYHLADNPREALNRSRSEGGVWITPKGDIIDDRFIRLSQGKEGVLIRRAKEASLQKEAQKNQEIIRKIEEEDKKIIEGINEFKGELIKSEGKREELVDERARIEFDINRLNYEIQSTRDDQSSDRKEIQGFAKSIREMQDEKKDIEREITRLNSNLSSLQEEQELLEENLKTTYKKRNSIRDRINHLNQQLSKLKDALNLKQEKEELEGQSRDLKRKIEEQGVRLDELREESGKLKEELEKKGQEISVKRKRYSNWQEERGVIERKIDAIQMELTRDKYGKDNITNEVFREFGVEIEPEKVEVVPDLEEEIAEVRESIQSLQPINPLAIDQYEEKKKELDNIEEEHNDLLDSRRYILKSIEEIDKKAEVRFQETFADIKEDFQSIYERLSPEGRADIKLTGDNILQSSIEVFVQPRGKKLQRMELLSTGEKTIAAVSLLLAIMLKRKSPIYIMDEIDAPLDENNIERFLELLQDFSENSQVLLVTHNRRTMEVSTSIYGVTMEEQGVSSVLSIDPYNII